MTVGKSNEAGKHTPEPWQAGGEFARGSVFAKRGPTLRKVCGNAPSPYMAQDEIDANAERIVACVNALAGLNPAAVGKVVWALQSIQQAYGDTSASDLPAYKEALAGVSAAARDALADLKGGAA